ncbi:Flp family type IVb pilin [Sinorhizobium americanum]|uniref:Flp pilus assembly protein, pilin Flp n=1 Tax=Sinorhizobium americanum TaxID=194963 RepID=A0A1L3LH92_9HYPH|nr:Flp family type IVb pilin [Sinorhizobium americanum]APG89461.1 Flp pilus assembly protein, pilin Flp [Sinorhizobium americanum]OAP36190.1 pilus assembly protein [Sinorhizobium americanum]
MKTILARLIKDESGATAIEYGLIAALISVALITGATALGTSLDNMFNALSGQMTTAQDNM